MFLGEIWILLIHKYKKITQKITQKMEKNNTQSKNKNYPIITSYNFFNIFILQKHLNLSYNYPTKQWVFILQ